jgi:hypothetical protein
LKILGRIAAPQPAFALARSLTPVSDVVALFRAGQRARCFAADATTDAATQCAPINGEVGANDRRINEAKRRVVATCHGGESRQRALVIFVLVKIESQSAAEADRRWKF